MANQLSMAQRETILALIGQGWSQRRISRELSVHRDTIARYIALAKQELPPVRPLDGTTADSKQAIPLTGSNPESDSKQAISITGSAAVTAITATTGKPGRQSLCGAFSTTINERHESGLSAQRIYQDLVSEHGFAGSYSSVRRFIQQLGKHSALPFRRMECAPGAEAQIDFGKGAWIAGADGKRRRSHVLRIVLSHSRKGYSEAVFRQSTDDLIACLENAFCSWGGITQTLVIDNLKAAVTQADWYDPELNPKLQAFCRHCGTVLLPTKSYTPRHKGKIESGINYVQENALRGRVFETLAAQNAYLDHWESHVADLRIHGTTKKQVREVFATIEKPALLPLPQERFPFFHEAQRSVHKDGHVEVDKSYYSVPPEYLGRTVWVRWDSRLVRIFNTQFVQIALHAKHSAGRFSTDSKHLAMKKISSIESGATELLRRARLIGPQSGRWAEAMLKERGIEGVRVLVGLLALARRHSSVGIERACELAVGHGVLRLRELRALLKKPLEQEQLEFMTKHPVIRGMGDYGAVVGVSFREGNPWREPPVEPPTTTESNA